MSREHEIWDENGHADMLQGIWGKPGHTGGRHWEVIYATVELIRGNMVLDAGCGMGHLYPILIQRNPDVGYIGFDSSKDMVQQAKEAFPNVNFSCGDIYHMAEYPICETVVSVDVLMHIPEIAQPIHEMWAKASKEVIIVHQIAPKASLMKKKYSGKIALSKGKELINRYDTMATMFAIFSTLDDLSGVEIFMYDPRSHIIRLTKGIPRYGSYKKGWQFG